MSHLNVWDMTLVVMKYCKTILNTNRRAATSQKQPSVILHITGEKENNFKVERIKIIAKTNREEIIKINITCNTNRCCK